MLKRLAVWTLALGAPLAYYGSRLFWPDLRPAWFTAAYFRHANLLLACAFMLVIAFALATMRGGKTLRITAIVLLTAIFGSYQAMTWGDDAPPYAATLQLPSGQWLLLEANDGGAFTSFSALNLFLATGYGPVHRVRALDSFTDARRGELALDADGRAVVTIERYDGTGLRKTLALPR